MARIAIDELQALTAAALRASGANPDMAESTARALVLADCEGLASHGVSRAPVYAAHVRSGRANGSAVPTVVRGRAAAVLIDAADGLAFPAAELAVHTAIARARESGVALAVVTNSHHFGAAASHLVPVAAAGMVGLAFSNSPAAMPAWGGRRALFGTNPIAAMFPRREGEPLVIDLSLSEAARGKLMIAARDGTPIPPNWALDAGGNPTTDAKAGLAGSMLPMGGVKGAMLALTVELLVCALGGSLMGFETETFFQESGPPLGIGQTFLVIDPDALAGREVFLERVETLIAAMLVDEGVRLPGARRSGLRRAAEREGLEIPDGVLAQLRTLAG